MPKKDPNYVVKIEQQIQKKYGEKATQHPKKDWTAQKEQEYLIQLKEVYHKELREEDLDKVEVSGVFVPRKLINKNSSRSCPVCSIYSFKSNDDVYMAKFECCEKCYIQWVEGREIRWNKGWRPTNEVNK